MSLRARSADRCSQHREQLQPERPIQTAARAESKASVTHREGEEGESEEPDSIISRGSDQEVTLWISVDEEILQRENSAERPIRHDSEVGYKTKKQCDLGCDCGCVLIRTLNSMSKEFAWIGCTVQCLGKRFGTEPKCTLPAAAILR